MFLTVKIINTMSSNSLRLKSRLIIKYVLIVLKFDSIILSEHKKFTSVLDEVITFVSLV